jgi:outer membrane protein, adhesin transport system
MRDSWAGAFRRRRLITGPLFAAAIATAAMGAGMAAAVDTAALEAGADGLAEALRATLRNHPAVAGQEAEVQASRYAADGVRSQRYPTVSAQAAQYAQGDRSLLSEENLSNPAVLRVRQPIWAFGRISNGIAVANAEVGTERADLLRVRRQLLEATAVAYAQVRGSSQRIEISRQNVTEHQELLAQIQRRADGQLASSADARLAATRLTQARAQLELAISEWQGAGDDLAILTQAAVNADQPVPPELLELPESPDLIDRAVDDSAEIHLKRQQLGQAEAEVALARTSFMPTIYLQADKLYDQPGFRDDSQVSVVFEGSLEGLGFAARGRAGQAAASRLAATHDLAAARLTLRRELESLWRSRGLQAELIKLQRESLGDLEALSASYQRQYETGTKSWLDLMNIQRERFELRRQLVQAQNDWEIYSLRLLAKTGGLDDLAGVRGHDDG